MINVVQRPRSGVCSVARVIGAALVLLCAADVLLAERQMQWGPVRVGIVRLDALRPKRVLLSVKPVPLAGL